MEPVVRPAAPGAPGKGHRTHPGPLCRGLRDPHRGAVLIVTVDFDVPVEVAFDYLADPANRPEWQSSLRRVELIDDGPPRVGMRWVDITGPGVRPDLEIAELDRPVLWAEHGQWRSWITAVLTLRFSSVPAGCRVRAVAQLEGSGPVSRLVATVATRLAPRALRSDLTRAARILSERAASQ